MRLAHADARLRRRRSPSVSALQADGGASGSELRESRRKRPFWVMPFAVSSSVSREGCTGSFEHSLPGGTLGRASEAPARPAQHQRHVPVGARTPAGTARPCGHAPPGGRGRRRIDIGGPAVSEGDLTRSPISSRRARTVAERLTSSSRQRPGRRAITVQPDPNSPGPERVLQGVGGPVGIMAPTCGGTAQAAFD